MVMRGESVIRPRLTKNRKDKERELAKRAKAELAKNLAAPIIEGPNKKPYHSYN